MRFISINELDACEGLKGVISSYYFIENQEVAHDNIPPLGFPVIKFHLRNNIKEFYSNYNFPSSEIMIVGQLTKFAKIKQEKNTRIIGVNLKPTALYKLFKKPAKYFTDKATPATDFFGSGITFLLEQLKSGIADSEKVQLLDNFFLNFINRTDVDPDRFDYLIETFIEKKGNISTDKIYSCFPVSERTLQRYFINRLGVNMKTFQRILRNLHLFSKLHEPGEKKLSALIEEIGYFDFSHFVKDFRLMTGMSPKEYFTNKEEFSHLLTQL